MSDPKPTTLPVFAHGSAWIRADVHLHTNSDKEFKYGGKPNEYASAYVQSLKEAGIRVGVVANHNKFDRDEFKALAKAAGKEDIYLLPGVELSVKDGANGIHTLVVFSPEWVNNQENENYIQNFLGVTFSGQANFENANGRSNDDMDETVRKLNEYKRDYFLVCAHVEEGSGLWRELAGGRLTELGQHEPFRERCLGFQKVRTSDDRVKVQGWLGNWYPAEVEGCDCKAIEDIGRGQATYLKLGAFTYEAVKFALLDHTNRVKPEPPKRTRSFIRDVHFEGSRLDGTTLRFSPELNTFIGIRGSGKSSIIESIRYAMGIELPERADSDGYKQGSVTHALGSGGKITITAVDRHGQEYEIRRILGEQPDVYVNNDHRPGINIRETVLHKPIYFGQKDLSSSGEGFENELVEKLVGDSLCDVRHEIAERKQTVIETVGRLRKLSDVADKQRECQDKKADAEHRLKVFQQHGVEEKLQKQVDFDQDSRTLKGLIDFVDS